MATTTMATCPFNVPYIIPVEGQKSSSHCELTNAKKQRTDKMIFLGVVVGIVELAW